MRSRGNGVDEKIDLRRLKGLGIDALLQMSSAINKLIASRAPELERRIKSMQAQLRSIKGR